MRVTGVVFALLAVPVLAWSQGTGALVGTIVAGESGEPLAYGIIQLPELGRELFTDEIGVFRLGALPPGPLLIRVRRLGYTPTEVTIPVRVEVTDTIRIQLARIALRLETIAVRENPPCLNPGPPDPARDSLLATIYGQIRLNAQQAQTLSRTHPFTYGMEILYSQTRPAGQREVVDSAFARFYSVRGWSYKPGQVVTKHRDMRGRSSQRFNIPMLADFADGSFIANHCFHYHGLVEGDAGPLVRVDFVAFEDVKTPDVHGSILLDPETYQIRRTEIRLSRLPSNIRGMTGMELITVFREILPSIPVIEHAWSEQRFDPTVRGVKILASHEEHALAAFDFIGPPPGKENKP